MFYIFDLDRKYKNKGCSYECIGILRIKVFVYQATGGARRDGSPSMGTR